MNKYDWFNTRYNYYHSSFQVKSKNAIEVEKPIDLKYFADAHHIKALRLECGAAFKKEKVDFSEYFAELLEVVNVEFLEVKHYRDAKLVIPQEIEHQNLLHFGIFTKDVTDLSKIGGQKDLRSLSISSHARIDLPLQILQCKELRSIVLRAKTGTIDPIYDLENIEEVNLQVNDLTEIGINLWKNLKDLSIISTELQSLPDHMVYENLEKLTLISNASFVIPDNYVSNRLKHIKINGADLELKLEKRMPFLEDIDLRCRRVPKIDAPKVKRVTLSLCDGYHIDELLAYTPALEDLKILDVVNSNPNFRASLTDNLLTYTAAKVQGYSHDYQLTDHIKFPIINIKGGGQNKVLLPTNANFSQVRLSNIGNESLDIGMSSYMDEDVSKGSRRKYDLSSKIVEISDAINLKTLKVGSGGKTLSIKNCPQLTELSFANMPKLLSRLSIHDCPSLDKLPAELFAANSNLKLTWQHESNTIKPDEFGKVLRDLSDEYNQATLLKIGEYILQDIEEHKPLMISVLAKKSRSIHRFLSQYLSKLSAQKTNFLTLPLENLKNKTITVVGKPHGTKTSLKSQAKELGMRHVTKAEDADYIIMCYGAEVSHQDKNVYLSEQVFEEYCQTNKPKFLVATASDAHIKKLRMIMWSVDPQSENMALEMLKKGGLLDEVIGEAVVISKTSSDPGVKRKYKAFLKGKVNETWQKILSSNKRSSLPLPLAEKSEYLRAKYKRGGGDERALLWTNRKDMDVRMDVVKNWVIPQVLEKPHYLRLPTLYSFELEYILDLPEIKGLLKRLIVNVIDKLPDNLGNHITLKQIEITCDSAELFPEVIYGLERLSTLNFRGSKLNYLDDKILELKKLTSIHLSSNEKISVPGNLDTLPKLKGAINNNWERRNS